MTTPFPLIVGSGRSGTTLLRNMLDAHSTLAVAHEAHFLGPMARARHKYVRSGSLDVDVFVDDLYANPNFRRQGLEEAAVRAALEEASPGDFAAAARVVLATYAAARGKSRFGDKTPGYVKHIAILADLFPEASFIHIIRDGRDVALAYLDREEWGPATVGEAALYWRGRVESGRESGRLIGEARYLEVRYEDLVDDPEATLRGICDFLELEYEPGMLTFYEQGSDFARSTATPEAFGGLSVPVTKGMRDWRIQMNSDDQLLFDVISGDLLEELGYERTAGPARLKTRWRAILARASWTGRRVQARLMGKRQPRGRAVSATGPT